MKWKWIDVTTLLHEHEIIKIAEKNVFYNKICRYVDFTFYDAFIFTSVKKFKEKLAILSCWKRFFYLTDYSDVLDEYYQYKMRIIENFSVLHFFADDDSNTKLKCMFFVKYFSAT